jgi:hypothetical protein
MADKLKLTEEELKSIQTAVSNLNQAKTILGDLSNQAYKAQLQVVSMEEAMAAAQKSLEDTYGSISVDLSTGEYEEVVEESETVEE